jgi:hypothetical protein
MSKFESYGIEVDEALDRLDAGIVVPRFMVHKFGKDPAASTAGNLLEATSQAMPYAYGAEASTIRIKAGGDAADDSGGTGARTVEVQGLDANYLPARETLTTAGASASSSTTTEFLRVLRVRVTTAGTGETNAADMVLEKTGTGDLCTILAGESSSQIGMVTVPKGYAGQILDIRLNTDITSGSGTLDVRGYSRKYDASLASGVTKPANVFFEKIAFTREQGQYRLALPDPYTFSEYTDIWFTASTSTGTAGASVSFTAGFYLT